MRKILIKNGLFKRVIIAVVTAALILFAIFAAALFHTENALAESLYIRKVVSVVCDDSASMISTTKWAYANYAMQAFCGMLNSEDRLYITYMSSDDESEQVDLSAGGIQAAVDEIRGRSARAGSTPYEAVETAFERLSNTYDSNLNTQYWLVVITDGAFTDLAGHTSSEQRELLNANFREYAQTEMPNGSTPQVNFLSINGAIAPDEDENAGIYVYSTQNASQITGAMNDMADRISGRTRLSADMVSKLDANTLSVSSSIPLLNIVIFTQGTDAAVTGATRSDGGSIPLERTVSLGYPGFSELSGGAFLIGDSQSAIGAGSYYITFNGDIDIDDVVVLFEPALETRMSLTLNGTELTDISELDDAVIGDTLSVSCDIYEMGTDTIVDPTLLPPGTSFEVTISEGGTVVENTSGTDMSISGFEIGEGETVITVTVSIDGFNPIVQSVSFIPQEPPQIVYTLAASDSNPNSVHIDEITDAGSFSVGFTVYANGVPITDPDEVRALSPEITASPSGNTGTVSYANDGTIVFTPSAAAIPDGEKVSFSVEVTCTLANGVSASFEYVVVLTNYSLTAESNGDPGGVHIDDIAEYGSFTVSFRVYADGVAITDQDAVRALSPEITASPSGNTGTVSYANDGAIVFTPSAAAIPEGESVSFPVEVTCTLSNGVSATYEYTVVLAQYKIVATDAAEQIKKTEFFGNTACVSFYITRDGVRINGDAVRDNFGISLNDGHADLLTEVVVADDGTVTVTPYIDDEHTLTFGSWWGNWLYYFGLSGSDVVVTFSSPYGSAAASIDVVGEDAGYQLLNVYLPLFIEIAIAVFLIAWIVLIIIKPRFVKGAKLYVGRISYAGGKHEITNFLCYELDKYNLPWRNGRWKFKRKPDIVDAGGIKVRALRRNIIVCENPLPWYQNIIRSANSRFGISEPLSLQYVKREAGAFKTLRIEEFSVYDSVRQEINNELFPMGSEISEEPLEYIVIPDSVNGLRKKNKRTVIFEGRIFIYIV